MKTKAIIISIWVAMIIGQQAERTMAFERVYTMGDKIESSQLIAYARVAEARELVPKGKAAAAIDKEIVGDYMYRLEIGEVIKGRLKTREAVVVQSPEYRADPRYFTEGQTVLVFLKNAGLSARFLSRYGLPRKSSYYETFANKQGVVALTDSNADYFLGSVKKYLSAKRAKRSQRPAAWASLLENSPDELKECALMELSSGPYYPALDLFIKYLGEEYLTSLAYKNLKLFPPDTLEARLETLMRYQKTDSRLVKVNLIKTISSIHDNDVFKFLQKSLKDDKFEVRATAAAGLEKWTDKKAVKSLKKALDDDDDYVRMAAYQALTSQGFKIEKNADSTYKIIQEPNKNN